MASAWYGTLSMTTGLDQVPGPGGGGGGDGGSGGGLGGLRGSQ